MCALDVWAREDQDFIRTGQEFTVVGLDISHTARVIQVVLASKDDVVQLYALSRSQRVLDIRDPRW